MQCMLSNAMLKYSWHKLFSDRPRYLHFWSGFEFPAKSYDMNLEKYLHAVNFKYWDIGEKFFIHKIIYILQKLRFLVGSKEKLAIKVWFEYNFWQNWKMIFNHIYTMLRIFYNLNKNPQYGVNMSITLFFNLVQKFDSINTLVANFFALPARKWSFWSM